MELEQQQNSFETKNELQRIIFEEFFVVSDGNYEINKKFNSKKYYGISKYLKVVMGNIEALNYQKEKINGNMLVSSEDKEVINSIYSLLFEKNYYGAFLKEFFEDEAKDIEADSKDDFLEKLDTKLTGKEKYLNILTFGVLDKSYSNGELNADLVLKLLKNFTKRLSIEKDFLVKYKLIEVEDKPDYEEILKEDIKKIINILNSYQIDDLEQITSDLNSGNFDNVDTYFKYVKQFGILSMLSNKIFENKAILNTDLVLYKRINEVSSIFNKLNFSSFLTKVSGKIASTQVELQKNSGHIENQEALMKKLEHLQSLSANVKNINFYLKSFREKQDLSFGKYLKQIDELVGNNYENSGILTLKSISDLNSIVELIEIDLTENDINTDILKFNFLDYFSKQLEKQELYKQIIAEIDSGNLFKVYINILRYRINYKEDSSLSRILRYIDETNIINKFYKDLFTKLEHQTDISNEIKSMQDFLLLIETDSFGTNDFDLENIKNDIEDLKYLFDKKNYFNEDLLTSSEAPKIDINIKNIYIKKLFENFRKEVLSHCKKALKGNKPSIEYLIKNKDVAYIKGNFKDFINVLINIENKPESSNSIINRLNEFNNIYVADPNGTIFTNIIIEDYFSDNKEKIENEIDDIVKGYIKAIKNNDAEKLNIYKNKSSKLIENNLLQKINESNIIYSFNHLRLFNDITANKKVISFIENYKNGNNPTKIKLFNEAIKEGLIMKGDDDIYEWKIKNLLGKKGKLAEHIDFSKVDTFNLRYYSDHLDSFEDDKKNPYIDEIMSDMSIDINEILGTKNKTLAKKSNIIKLVKIAEKLRDNSLIGKKDEKLSAKYEKLLNKMDENMEAFKEEERKREKQRLEEEEEKEELIKIEQRELLGLENSNAMEIYYTSIESNKNILQKYKGIIANSISEIAEYDQIESIEINEKHEVLILNYNGTSFEFEFNENINSQGVIPIDFYEFLGFYNFDEYLLYNRFVKDNNHIPEKYKKILLTSITKTASKNGANLNEISNIIVKDYSVSISYDWQGNYENYTIRFGSDIPITFEDFEKEVKIENEIRENIKKRELEEKSKKENDDLLSFINDMKKELGEENDDLLSSINEEKEKLE